jgi:hypothetical protein
MGSSRPTQEGDHTIAIVVLTLTWVLGFACGVISTLLVQAGIIVK